MTTKLIGISLIVDALSSVLSNLQGERMEYMLNGKTFTNSTPALLDERIKKVLALDLGPIKFKLVHGKHEPISVKEVGNLEKRYKHFLILCLKYPERRIVPDKGIDTFWHTHILDTQKYATDCENVFGHFLHHFPYFGMRGEKDAKELQISFKETRDLFRTEFGETYETSEDCQVSDCDAPQCDPAECHNIRPTLVAV